MAATWAIESLDSTGLLRALISSTIAFTAWSIPLLIIMGLAPAATFFRPSFIMACASKVAVVVPSPATSLVFMATSLTNWQPRFSHGSLRSISRAMVTPSLVMVGEPNLRSSTTFLPLGPRVTFTALARVSTPLSNALLASSPNFISLDNIYVSSF